jgi:SAM-dependent methyltransferase
MSKKLNIGSSTCHLNGWINLEYDENCWEKSKKIESLNNTCSGHLRGSIRGQDNKGNTIATYDWPDEYGDVLNLKYENNTFDFIRSGHVMEHIPNKIIHRAIKEQYRVLKPGGWCVISVPSFDILLDRWNNRDKYIDFWTKTQNDKGLWYDSELKKPFETIDEAFVAILYLNGEHLNAFTKVILTKMMERCGFKNIQSADEDEQFIPDGTMCEYSLRLKGQK